MRVNRIQIIKLLNLASTPALENSLFTDATSVEIRLFKCGKSVLDSTTNAGIKDSFLKQSSTVSNMKSYLQYQSKDQLNCHSFHGN